MEAIHIFIRGDSLQYLVLVYLVRQWKLLPAEYIVLICHYAQQPKESVIDNLERFMGQIKPALDELTPYAPDTVAVAN